MKQSSTNLGYKSILKSSAIFGGTQIFIILINLVRGKAIAVFLGPTGIGISSLLTNTANMIQQFSSCGVNLTAVKDVSQAESSNDNEKLLITIKHVRLIVLILGIIGFLVSIFFARQLSIFTFGNDDYVYHFRLLSFFILITTISNGELSILQGNKKLRKIAIGSIVGGFLGVLVGIPFYYYWGIEGIVPGMLALASSTMIVNLFLNRDNIKKIRLSAIFFSEFWTASKRMITLGAVLMISVLLGTFSTYFLNIFITKNGGVNDVGYFQSANSMTNQYIGLVFTAMSIDYFPKLASVCNNKKESNVLVNNQLEIVLLIVAPIIGLFMLFAPLVVNILLTPEFLIIVPLLNAMALGAFFKAASYPIGYISFAKGDKKVFFWLEGVFGNALQLSLNVICYKIFGLEGLGFSFVIIYIIYLIVVSLVVGKKYAFRYKKSTLKLMVLLGICCIGIFCTITFLQQEFIKYLFCVIFLVSLSLFSIYELDKRINFLETFRTKFKK